MKNIKWVLFFAVSLAVFGGAFMWYTKTSSDALTEKLTELESFVGEEDWRRADEVCDEMIALWEKIKFHLEYLMTHEDMRTIDVGIARLKEYIKIESKELMVEEMATVKKIVRYLYERERITVGNVF